MLASPRRAVRTVRNFGWAPLWVGPKKRTETYVKAQKLLFDEAAYLYKWGLRGVWGISNRVDYEAPADEVDRMFIVTPRKK